MTQPAPRRGDRVIELGIPIGYSRTQEFEQAILPISHEYTDMFASDASRRWYQIVDNAPNRRQITALILVFPEILTKSNVNRVDPDFFETDSGTAE